MCCHLHQQPRFLLAKHWCQPLVQPIASVGFGYGLVGPAEAVPTTGLQKSPIERQEAVF
jgi:hypothetical protein